MDKQINTGMCKARDLVTSISINFLGAEVIAQGRTLASLQTQLKTQPQGQLALGV